MKWPYAALFQPFVASMMTNPRQSEGKEVRMCVSYTLLCLRRFSLINWLTESAEPAEPTLGRHTHTHTHRKEEHACILRGAQVFFTTMCKSAVGVRIKGIVVVLSFHSFLSVSINRPVTVFPLSQTNRCWLVLNTQFEAPWLH